MFEPEEMFEEIPVLKVSFVSIDAIPCNLKSEQSI